MMEIASTAHSEAAPLQQSTQNSCFNDKDLMDSVQARNLAISNVQLGNKLAKPCLAEQSPSAGFVYGRVSTVGAVKRRTTSEPKAGNSHGCTPDKDSSKLVERDARLSSKVRSKSSERILNLSASNNGLKSTSHGLDHTIDIAQPGTREQVTRQPQSYPQEKQNVSLPQSSRHQGLQALTNNIDVPTLSKLLAFTYQKEANQKNQLITRLKSDLNNKEDGLAYVLGKQKDFETRLETAYHRIEKLQERIEILEQQQEEDPQDGTQRVNVVHYLKTFDRKLNLLIKERLSQEGQQEDVSQASKYTKQIAEDHQQNRHQMRGSQPLQRPKGNSAIDKHCHTIIREKAEHIAESQELPYIGRPRYDFGDPLLDEFPRSPKSQAGKPQNNLATNMEESQELHYIGKERLDLNCSQNDESKSLKENQQPSTPVSTSQHNQGTENDSCRGSQYANKFQTRKRTITQSESSGSMDDRRFKKPANHISKLGPSSTLKSNKEIQKTARDVDDKLPKETKPLAERDINTLQIHLSQKNKSSRGQGGG